MCVFEVFICHLCIRPTVKAHWNSWAELSLSHNTHFGEMKKRKEKTKWYNTRSNIIYTNTIQNCENVSIVSVFIAVCCTHPRPGYFFWGHKSIKWVLGKLLSGVDSFVFDAAVSVYGSRMVYEGYMLYGHGNWRTCQCNTMLHWGVLIVSVQQWIFVAERIINMLFLIF